MQEEKDQQHFLASLEDQIVDSSDKDLNMKLEAAFKPNFDVRPYQAAFIKLVLQQQKRIVIAECPCAYGKSVILAVYSRYLLKQNPYERVLIAVPNFLLEALAKLDCGDSIHHD